MAGGCLGSQSVAQACNLRLFNVPTTGTAAAAAAGGAEAEAVGATWVTGWLPLAAAVAATVYCGWA